MAIPVLLYVASASQALPIVVAALVGGRPLPVSHRRLALWCCLLVLLDVADLIVGANTGNNRWTAYLTLPVEIGMTLWILSSWQSPRWARAYLLAVPVIGTIVAMALLLTDPARTFDVWVAPFLALLGLAASLHTLVARALQSSDTLIRLDWFWISLGMAIFWVVQVSSPVFAFTFMGTHLDWVVTILLFRTGLMILAFVCMDRLGNDLRLSADQSLAVYHIAQEALTNVVKHARSPKATIEVWHTGRHLEMQVEDYGAGFAANGNRPHGLGLTSMAERARSAGGMLSVESYPDGGTRVHLRLPVDESK